MQQGNMTINTTWSINLNFFGFVNNDDIYTSNGELIGVNLKKYQTIEQALITCKNKLIELGAIEVEKTPEEIIKEQSEMIKQQSQAMNELLITCKELKSQIDEVKNEYQSNKRDNKLFTGEHTQQCVSSVGESIADNRPNENKNTSGCNASSSKSKK